MILNSVDTIQQFLNSTIAANGLSPDNGTYMLTQMVPTLDVQILIFAVINLLSLLLNDEI